MRKRRMMRKKRGAMRKKRRKMLRKKRAMVRYQPGLRFRTTLPLPPVVHLVVAEEGGAQPATLLVET